MKFILSIDTEADNQWSHGVPLTTKNISFIPPFQELCNRFDITPTYLVTSEICDDENAVRILKGIQDRNQCEIGTHLHVWTTPPFLVKDGYRYNDPAHAFAHEIPSELFEKKLEFLTNQIKTSFGHPPVSFRSGRYGYNKSMAEILANYGYKIDSSVTPYISWRKTPGLENGNGGPDFSRENNHPYNVNSEHGQILEVPVTILYTKEIFKNHPEFASFILRYRNKYINKILSILHYNNQPLWLRPSPKTTLADLIEVVNCAENMGLQYLVMMFHSSELMPGGSPYWKDQEGIKNLYKLLTEFFIFLNHKNILSISLSDTLKNK